jgi:outer membrane lipoprotein-sorting protein
METWNAGTLARTREIDVTEQTDPRGEHRTFLRFTSPADVQNTRFLHLSPRDDKDQQWLWAPTTRRTRRLGDAQRDENFFGTDLSYRDLELLVRIQQWNDSEATATLVGEETVDGHPCRVVELVPKNHEFPYTKYRLWFGTDDYLLWRVDVYQEDEVLKRVTPKKYEKIGPYQTAVESDIANLPANTKTIFTLRNVRYDAGVSEGVFTVSNLDKG